MPLKRCREDLQSPPQFLPLKAQCRRLIIKILREDIFISRATLGTISLSRRLSICSLGLLPITPGSHYILCITQWFNLSARERLHQPINLPSLITVNDVACAKPENELSHKDGCPIANLEAANTLWSLEGIDKRAARIARRLRPQLYDNKRTRLWYLMYSRNQFRAAKVGCQRIKHQLSGCYPCRWLLSRLRGAWPGARLLPGAKPTHSQRKLMKRV